MNTSHTRLHNFIHSLVAQFHLFAFTKVRSFAIFLFTHLLHKFAHSLSFFSLTCWFAHSVFCTHPFIHSLTDSLRSHTFTHSHMHPLTYLTFLGCETLLSVSFQFVNNVYYDDFIIIVLKATLKISNYKAAAVRADGDYTTCGIS